MIYDDMVCCLGKRLRRFMSRVLLSRYMNDTAAATEVAE